MLSLRHAKKKLKKNLYFKKQDPTERPKTDLMEPTEHSEAVNVKHEAPFTEEQTGVGSFFNAEGQNPSY